MTQLDMWKEWMVSEMAKIYNYSPEILMRTLNVRMNRSREIYIPLGKSAVSTNLEDTPDIFLSNIKERKKRTHKGEVIFFYLIINF